MTWAGRAALAHFLGVSLAVGPPSITFGKEPPTGPVDVTRTAQQPGQLLGRSFPHGAAELLTYGLTPEQFRELETKELTTLVGEIYRPEKSEQDRIAAEITRLQTGRWDNNPEIQPYSDLLAKRAARFGDLSRELKPNDSPWKQIRQLRRDPEFNKLLNEIKQFEYKHTHNLNVHLERIEAMIDPAKVAEAHQDWPKRVRSLRSSVHIARLCDGLQTRKALLQKQDLGTAPVGEPPPGTPPLEPVANGARRHSPPPPPRGGVESAQVAGAGQFRPLSEWEKYVLEFIERYKLTEAQSNSALAILKELSSRAAQVETLNKDRIAAAEKITDMKLRQERLAGLAKPIDDLFGQLKQRLDRLLSAEQRNRAHSQPPPRPSRSGRRGA